MQAAFSFAGSQFPFASRASQALAWLFYGAQCTALLLNGITTLSSQRTFLARRTAGRPVSSPGIWFQPGDFCPRSIAGLHLKGVPLRLSAARLLAGISRFQETRSPSSILRRAKTCIALRCLAGMSIRHSFLPAAFSFAGRSSRSLHWRARLWPGFSKERNA